MLLNNIVIASIMSVFVILVVVQLDCYYFWWCECSYNAYQL